MDQATMKDVYKTVEVYMFAELQQALESFEAGHSNISRVQDAILTLEALKSLKGRVK